VLVGREAELQAIDRLLAAARLGTSGTLVIAGDPGVGKTALVEEALGAAGGLRLLRATGLEAESEVPFAGLFQLLRPALDLIGSIPPVQADALSAALSLTGTEAEVPTTQARGRDRFAIGAAVLALVCRYAEDGPVVLSIDDLHLLDKPSADALVFAVRRLAADPVAVLATARTPEAEALIAGLPVLRLNGLELADAHTLVAGRRDALSEERLTFLHRATAGNPLALIELAGSDLEDADRAPSDLPLRVPAAVTTAFARRIEQLDEACRSVLLVAAVCGGDLRVTADACARLDVDAGRLADAEDAGLVSVRDDRIDFRHPLLRAATYSLAGTRERRAAHQAAADVLPQHDVDRRAWHLAEAVWHPDSSVSDLLARAAANAVARAAYSVASTAYERAARLNPARADRDRLVLLAAETAWLAGQGDRTLTLLDRHATEATTTRDRVRELELRGAVAARTGSVRAAMELLSEAAEHTANAEDAAVLVADAVHASFYLADARVLADLGERQARLLDSVSSPRSRALGLMSTGMARILAGSGGVAEVRAAVPLLETTPELRDDPRRIPWLLLAPLFLRDSTGGARLRVIVDEVRGSAGVGTMPAVLFHVARDQATTEAWAQAEASYLEAIRLADETGQETEEAMSLAGLAWLEARQGNETACREHAGRAQVMCARRDIHLGEAWAAFALGDLELSLGNGAAAVDQLQGLSALLDRLGIRDPDLLPTPELTEALVRVGRHEEAVVLADGFHEIARGKGQPWALARAERAQALVAPDDSFDAAFETALALHEETLDRFETARTLLTHGERLRRCGRRVDARPRLRAALETFDALGASRWSERAASELTATGQSIHRSGGGLVSALTPQELQVSLLLAEGRTTREAATALFLSPKTVEYHLRKVYTKLAIRSREELATALREVAGTDPDPARPRG
jgi:DNA-binding CsgD family transcriptional regulator